MATERVFNWPEAHFGLFNVVKHGDRDPFLKVLGSRLPFPQDMYNPARSKAEALSRNALGGNLLEGRKKCRHRLHVSNVPA